MQKFLLALKIKPFLYLWLAEVFSQIAMNMMNFIMLLVVFSLTNSNTAVSGFVLAITIPAIFFGILAGVYVDRWNKKRVLFLTNVIRMALIFLLAIFHRNLIVLYIIAFLVSVVTQFFIPAETPMIPLLVEKEYLIAANALFSMAWFGSVFIAYALSGPFLLLFGNTNALFVLCFLFLIASFCAFIIPMPKKQKDIKKVEREQISLMKEIKKAFAVILKIRDVSHAFFLLALSQILTLIISVLGPGYAKHIMNVQINEFPIFFVTPSIIGMAVGAYLMTNYFHRFSRHKSATLGLFIAAGTIILMPYGSKVASKSFIHTINSYLPSIINVTILHIIVILAFLLGIANSFIFVPSNTLVQENTSDELRGKVYGALNAISALASLIPIIMVGSLADIYGVGNVLTILGVIIGLIAVSRIML
jgi:MFS family permease